MSAADQFRRWYDYEIDGNAKVLGSLERIPETSRQAPEFRRALDLAAHIMTARRLWLYRFGVEPTPVPDLFPKGLTLRESRDLATHVENAWTGYLAALDDKEVDRIVEYQSLEGPRYQNSVGDVLTQLFGHSWYHRGQIAALVRSMGYEPAETDFIFWSRDPIL